MPGLVLVGEGRGGCWCTNRSVVRDVIALRARIRSPYDARRIQPVSIAAGHVRYFHSATRSRTFASEMKISQTVIKHWINIIVSTTIIIIIISSWCNICIKLKSCVWWKDKINKFVRQTLFGCTWKSYGKTEGKLFEFVFLLIPDRKMKFWWDAWEKFEWGKSIFAQKWRAVWNVCEWRDLAGKINFCAKEKFLMNFQLRMNTRKWCKVEIIIGK